MTDLGDLGDLGDPEPLLRRVRRGDQEAARQLVERLYPLVARVVRAHVPRGQPPEDWEQEAFLRVFRNLDQYRGPAPLEHWVARIAVNVCLDHLRRRRQHAEVCWEDLTVEEVALLHTALAQPDTKAQAVAARELVGKLLDTLPAEDRVVLRMLDLEARSVAEIATLLGRGQSWVKVRAFRARQKLSAALARLNKDNRDG